MATMQLVIFDVDNEEYGINISKVKSIESPMDIYRIPDTPEYAEGIINLRDTVIAVLSFRKMLGLPGKEADDNTRIIVANVNSASVGLVVDSVNEIANVEALNIEAVPDTMTDDRSRFMTGVAKIDERVIYLINPESLHLM